MATHDALSQEIEKLFAAVPVNSLPQWQYAYKRVIYAMGMKILEMFPENVIGKSPGPSPSVTSGAQPESMAIRGTSDPHMDGGTGGQSGGPIINIVIAALCQKPVPPPKS